MNWTGGRLARHSGTAKKTKQKQHFARIKQNLQGNAQGNQPVRWNILNRVVDEQTGAHWSLRPISPQSDDGQTSTHHSRHAHSSIPPCSSVRKGSAQHSSRTDGLQKYHEAQIRIKRERLDDQEDDIYDASPPRRDTKRRRKDTDGQHDGGRKGIDIEERRMRLLRKGNWIGSAALAPPKVVFNSPTREDKFGKRRRLTEQDRSRVDARRSHMPVAGARRSNPHKLPSSNATFSKPLGRTDVRISIGGREIPPGISSSAKASKTSGQLPLVNSSRVDRAVLSSSVMLLDDESSSSVAIQTNETRRRDSLRSSPPSAPILQNIWGRQEAHSVNEDWRHTSSQIDLVPAYGSEQPRTKRSSSQSYFLQTSNVPVTTSPMSAMKIRARNGQMAYSSSSAQIQHPMPQTFKVFSHFRSNSSNLAESNVAQVGIQELAGPKSQLLDNDIWNAWMAPLPEESDGDQTNLGEVPDISISPGVSALPGRYEKHQDFLSTSSENGGQSASMYQQSDDPRSESGISGVDENTGSQQEETSAYHGNYEKFDTGSPKSVTSSFSNRSDEGTFENGNRHLRQDSRAQSDDKHETPKPQLNEIAISVVNPNHKVLPEVKMPHVAARADPDEIWKRFVFGSGGNESDSDDNSPWQTRFAMDEEEEEEFTALSMIAQQSAGDQWSSSSPDRHQRMSENVGNQMASSFNSLSPSIVGCGTIDGNFKHQKHHNPVDRTEPSTTEYSSRAVKGTVAASSLDSPAASKCVVAHNSSSSIAFGDESAQKQNIVFTKPKAFFGRQTAGLDFDSRDETLHIGRRLMESGQGRRQTKQGTTEKMGDFADDIWESDEDEMDDPIEG